MPTTPTSRCRGSSRSSKRRWPSPLLRPCSAWPCWSPGSTWRETNGGAWWPTAGTRRPKTPYPLPTFTSDRTRSPDGFTPPTGPGSASHRSPRNVPRVGHGPTHEQTSPSIHLERLTDDERGQLLGELLVAHPEQVAEAERLALAKLAIVDVDEVAESLERALREAEVDQLAHRPRSSPRAPTLAPGATPGVPAPLSVAGGGDPGPLAAWSTGAGRLHRLRAPAGHTHSVTTTVRLCP